MPWRRWAATRGTWQMLRKARCRAPESPAREALSLRLGKDAARRRRTRCVPVGCRPSTPRRRTSHDRSAERSAFRRSAGSRGVSLAAFGSSGSQRGGDAPVKRSSGVDGGRRDLVPVPDSALNPDDSSKQKRGGRGCLARHHRGYVTRCCCYGRSPSSRTSALTSMQAPSWELLTQRSLKPAVGGAHVLVVGGMSRYSSAPAADEAAKSRSGNVFASCRWTIGERR
eukprot:scaffold183_cov249-Pinguiococcus_pyrenoidosus.AAC.17